MSVSFCHLHNHTGYSLLDGAANIGALVRQNKLLGMNALAITDHGNMFGVPKFVNAAKREGIKPIIGCEFYIAADMQDHKDKKRYHQLLLAKSAIGYQNISKLCSLSFTKGYYYKPRVDRETIAQHAEGLIATTCCLAAEVPQAILSQGEEAAEAIFLAWLEIFGADYYIELQRHGIAEQDQCNEVLMRWSKKHGVKVIATNDVHYIKQEDSLAQDIMLCLQTGKNFDDPKRMRFSSNQFYLKSPQEMLDTFSDIPEAIHNTLEIVDKIETPSLQRDLLMPMFSTPAQFATQADYLKHLTFERGKLRYQGLTEVIVERLNFELDLITNMGFSGYFLIVQDMVQAAQKLGVCVGPGRGSVAGSAVAYALGITAVDPLRYQLLFERFLNPERISMPDIDIDFDDEGRQKVIDYLVQKYGYEHVAHIITFNVMGPKSAIRDVARVLNLPLPKADALAKLIPDKLGTTLDQAFASVPALRAFLEDPASPEGKVLSIGKTLENSPRHTGIHAAGVIISPKKLTTLLPIKTDKNTNLLVTQYDGSMVEDVGMLKMDLLGLKTLSIIRDALHLIEKTCGKNVDITKIPLDDAKTFQVYQEGSTIGIFQFESEGMRSHLKNLHPTELEHLVAMNALYRPGPMQNIPLYIARMHGKEKVDYMHPVLEGILKTTYGIPVYQEQIMRIAQVIAGYSLGQADILRRAMGKKKEEEMQKQEAIFVKGAYEKNKVEAAQAKKIFETMSHFAKYGFNRSHAMAYSLLSYQTAYLKAHYPAAYMASLLIHHQHNLEKITFFIEECNRLKITVKGPVINESHLQFSNDTEHSICFGLAAIKGLGAKAMEPLIAEREQHGPFADFHDLIRRLIIAHGGKALPKKLLETLALAGAFDDLDDLHRKQYVEGTGSESFIEQVLRYELKKYKEEQSTQQLLFALTPDALHKKPTPPICTPYSEQEKLKMEKERVGFYISGHPLDSFALELKSLCNTDTQNIVQHKDKKELRLAGVVMAVQHRQNSKGSHFGILTLEDYKGPLDIMLFGETYSKHRYLLVQGQFVFLKGKLKARYGREDQWDFRPVTIEPLETVMEKYTRMVQIMLPIAKITPAFTDDIIKLFKTYQGKCEVKLLLPHDSTKTSVHTFVRNFRVTPSKLFFSELDKRNIRYIASLA